MAYSQQDDTPPPQNSLDSFGSAIEQARVTIGGGMFMPMGKLSRYYGPSPFFELAVDYEVRGQKAIGMTFQAIFPDQRNEFVLQQINDTIDAKSTLILNFTFDFKKTLKTYPNGKLEVKLGVGGSIVTTDARNPLFRRDNEESRYEHFGSILFTPAFEYRHRFSKHAQFVFGLGINFTPYRVDNAVEDDIGGFALMPKIAYIF
jgi:hypothetical protein